jgi:hypothetical protein
LTGIFAGKADINADKLRHSERPLRLGPMIKAAE